MDVPRVMIAAPARNRAWILPRYLDALAALDYPRDFLLFHWIVNDSTDDSLRLLQEWCAGRPRAMVHQEDTGRTESEYAGALRLAGPRSRAYPILADLRNCIREWVLVSGVDYLLSVDTDILVRPDTLRRLLSHQVDVVAALVDNGHRAHNFLSWDSRTGDFYRRPAQHISQDWLTNVGLTGACCLYSRRALGAGTWGVGVTGEDEGFARCMLDVGIDQWVDGGHQLEHVMEAPCQAC